MFHVNQFRRRSQEPFGPSPMAFSPRIAPVEQFGSAQFGVSRESFSNAEAGEQPIKHALGIDAANQTLQGLRSDTQAFRRELGNL